MSLKLRVLWIFLFIACSESQTNLNDSKWLTKLVKSITNNSKQYQVVFIVPDEKSDQESRFESFIRAITQKFPSLKITIQGLINSKTKYPTLKSNPRRTGIFILILDSGEPISSSLSTSTEFLNRLAKEKSRPKFLIVHLLKERCFAYKKLFKKLWAKRF